MRRIPRPRLAVGFRRHKGLGLFDCGPLARTRLDKRADVRPRIGLVPGDKAELDWVGAGDEDNGNSRCRGLSRKHC